MIFEKFGMWEQIGTTGRGADALREGPLLRPLPNDEP